MLVAPGAIVGIVAQLRETQQRLAEVEAEATRLRDDSAWLNAELARLPVRATRKALAIVDGLRRR